MEKYKDILNRKELDYVTDIDFLISKHKISEKINTLLRDVESRLQNYLKTHDLKLPAPILMKAGKISKGENYRLLPYLILDFPRYFHPEAVFAYRTMFWWGNFFSCTLHLQGNLLNNFREVLQKEIVHLKEGNFYIATSDTPWEYHYNEDNYQLLDSLSHSYLDHLLKNKPFIKLSRYIKIEEHNQLPTFAEETFDLVIKCLGIKENKA